jgi:hypothetical protein
MRKKKRKWDKIHEDDPGAGLLNLFDVWIAFAAALVLAIVSYSHLPKPPAPTDAAQAALEPIQDQHLRLERYRVSQQTVGGDGERLGTAYRLKTGEVIYVPEGAAAKPATAPPEPNAPGKGAAQ